MIELTFSKSGWDDIVLTEDDLFDFRFERGCFSGDTFELGGVSAKSIYMILDNNTQRFPRGAFANSRVRLDIDGHFCGYFNAELPKRRNGVIELTAYDDMIKLDTEFPKEVQFPQTFISVYGHCVLAAGLADHFSIISGDTFVLNALFNNGVISHEYTDYIYANSCRNVVSGMAEWNGGFAYINDDGKLQVDVFSKEVSRTFYSCELMDFDYSDETVVFSKIKTSQKNKTYEMGDDSGYTLIINNQYIGYGLDDEDFEMYLGFIYDYYKDFSLTPMSFTLAEPDFSLKTGDRISVVDEEENVTVTGNISEISVSGNCSMTVTCGGFGNVSGVVNYNKSSTGQNNLTKAEAGSGGVGKAAESDPTSEYFNDYDGNSVTGSYNHVEGKDNSCSGVTTHIEGQGNSVPSSGGGLHVEGIGNTASGYGGVHVEGNGNTAKNCNAGAFVGGRGNTAANYVNASIIHGSENKVYAVENSIISGSGNTFNNYVPENCMISGWKNTFNNSRPRGSILGGSNNDVGYSYDSVAVGYECKFKGSNSIFIGKNLDTDLDCGAVFGKDNVAKNPNSRSVFMFGQGLADITSHSFKTFMGEYNQNVYSITTPWIRKNQGSAYDALVEMGNGIYNRNGAERSTGFVIDTAGRVFCNRVYQLDKSNINENAENGVTLTGDFCLPCVRFIDHEPTTEDLTGEPCLFVQYGEKKINTGPTSIFEVKGLFVEKSVQ